MGCHGLSVTVIGGGIRGLTAGLSLLEGGLDVHVYEQSARINEVGAGIAVSPNATRILYRVGLEQELARTGVRSTAWWQHAAPTTRHGCTCPTVRARQARDAQLANGTTAIFFSAWEWLYRHNPEAALTQTHRTDLHQNRNRDPA